MDKFDLKKFLTENKLTKTSILREGEDLKVKYRDYFANPNDVEVYEDKEEWKKAIENEYKIKFANLSLKPGDGTETSKSYSIPASPGVDSKYVGGWNDDKNFGIVVYKKPSGPRKSLAYIEPGSKHDKYGTSGMPTMEENLRTKIKEMIIAELSLEEENKYSELDFVAEGEDYEDAGVETGEVGEKDYEDYQELKKFLNSLEDTKNPKASDDIFNYGSEIDPNEGYDEFDAQYDEKFKLSEYFLDEAKKDEEEAPAEEELSDEEIDTTIDTTDTGEDFNIDTSAVNPNIKAVQDALTQAQAAAKSINDDKLTQQIGNTITMFTRTHIANTEPISEGKSLTDGLTPEEKKIYDKVKNTITYKGMKKYDSKEYSKKLQKALQAAAMHNEESER